MYYSRGWNYVGDSDIKREVISSTFSEWPLLPCHFVVFRLKRVCSSVRPSCRSIGRSVGKSVTFLSHFWQFRRALEFEATRGQYWLLFSALVACTRLNCPLVSQPVTLSLVWHCTVRVPNSTRLSLQCIRPCWGTLLRNLCIGNFQPDYQSYSDVYKHYQL